MSKIVCIDFDGTIVQHAYPNMGEPMPMAFEVMKSLKEAGYKLILWTCREDGTSNGRSRKYLTEAVEFCKERGVEFDAVNETLLDQDFRDEKSLKRKPYANYYIDDAIPGGFVGWDYVSQILIYGTSKINDRFRHLHIGETKKAHDRRVREGWFDKYAPADKPGLDIGCQFDALNLTFRRWDTMFGDGDGTILEGVPDETYFTVYASHVMEHIPKPLVALKNWWRVLKPGGHLILMVPHRDLYEKRTSLPSYWNPHHKWFFLPEQSEKPCTLSFKSLIQKALPEGEIVSFQVLDEGYDHSLSQYTHPVGEFSIEAIIKKP